VAELLRVFQLLPGYALFKQRGLESQLNSSATEEEGSRPRLTPLLEALITLEVLPRGTPKDIVRYKDWLPSGNSD
jgi:hypothetical protein